jgi:hypothetical protein
MIASPAVDLARLYEDDETAWLDHMAELVRAGRLAELDCANLGEFLADMARRDRREVVNRLSVLLAHRLKWDFQAEKRSPSWRATVETQRQQLGELLESATLRAHAADVLAKAYANGVRQAEADTGLPAATFPADCPYPLDGLLADDWAGAEA